jgi:hypothetical protein
MCHVLILLMTIVLLCLFFSRVPLPLLLYPSGDEVTRKVTELVTIRFQSGLYLYLLNLYIFL